MRFLGGWVVILFLLAGSVQAGTRELYEALGSPAGRYLLGEIGAGAQISERWAALAQALGSDQDPAEVILERVRSRFVREYPGEAGAFGGTVNGPVFLREGVKARLQALLEQESAAILGGGPRTASAEAAPYARRREAFLADEPFAAPKEQWLRQSSFRPESGDQALDEIRAEAIARARGGERATVVFDLDETGIDNRFGTAAMILGPGGWAESAESLRFPRARAALKALRLGQFRVTAEDLFAAAGIPDERAALKSVDDYLDARIHEPGKAQAFGVPYPGFVEYVRSLHEAGVRIVYLTGRHAADQTLGTREMLRFFGLPLDDGARLFLKPGTGSTAAYKVETLHELITTESARIVAIFDNEPENLLAEQAGVSGARIVFVDTDFARVPAEPARGWYRISRW